MFLSPITFSSLTMPHNGIIRYGHTTVQEKPKDSEKCKPVNGKPASKRDLKEVSHLLSEQMDHLLTMTKDNVSHYKDMVSELKLINKRQMDLGYAGGFDAWMKRLWSTLAVSGPTGVFIGLTIKLVEFLASNH